MTRRPCSKAVLAIKEGESVWTEQGDRAIGALAYRHGFKISTENYWAVPIKAAHNQKTARAIRLCRVTRV